MARKKKLKWKYKFLTKDKYEEYERMGKDAVIEQLKVQVGFLEEKKAEKRSSETIKTCSKEVSDHRKNWSRNDELESAKQAYEDLKKERDKEVEDIIEDRKAMAGGYADHIKGAEEHRDALLRILRRK